MSRREPTPGFAEYVTREIEAYREAQRTGAEYPPRDNRTLDELFIALDRNGAELEQKLRDAGIEGPLEYAR